MILRGQVHWVDFQPPQGRRPAIVVSHDRANRGHTVVLVAPVTNSVPQNDYPSVVRFDALQDAGGITGCARFDAIQAVPREWVEEAPVHVLTGADLIMVNMALRAALGL